ncbi:MAG: hypothetical protein ABMA64_32165, partial [Myxococcota bacterium]
VHGWPLFDTAATRRIEALAATGLARGTLMQRAGLGVARLALALAPCTEGPATLAVTYGEGRGRVVLSAPWRAGCSPGPDGSLAPVARVGRAVAQWRNALAARFDARLAAFTVRIRVTPECDLALFGQFPPDGTSFAACDATGCGTEVVARGCR